MPRLRPAALVAGLGLAALALLLAPTTGRAQRAPLSLATEDGEVTIVADELERVGGATDLLVAVGNVEITRGATRLVADRVEVNRDTGDAVAQGRVVFYDGQDRLVAERIDYNLRTGTGVVYRGSAFAPPYYSLTGERLDRLGESVYQLRDGTLTTCEGDDPFWWVRIGSGTLALDDMVYGRDASFWVRGVPVLPWVPFFAAALRRERQSGFLFPTLGYSGRKGAFAVIPYYWAISDSQDLTVAPQIFTRRGLGVDAGYRYVISERQAGRASVFYLKELFEGDRDRAWGHLRHTWQITDRLSLWANGNVTSDDDVFRHYGDRLFDRSLERVETNVFATQRWDAFALTTNILWYQDLTSTRAVELQRVPEVRLEGFRQPVPGVPGLLWDVRSSFTNFVRDVGAGGVRGELAPRLSYPIPVAGVLTLTPFLGARLLYYDHRVVGQGTTRSGSPPDSGRPERIAIEQTARDHEIRPLAEFGVEAESRVTRVFPLDGVWNVAAVQHVIEPRLAWVAIHGEGPDDFPQYDPAIDGVRRTSLLGWSLINRINAKTVAGPGQEPGRWEAVRFTLSQGYDVLVSDRPFSPLRAELILSPGRLVGFRGDVSVDVYGRGLETANADFSLALRDVTVAVGTRMSDAAASARFHALTAQVSARLTPFLSARVSSDWDVRAGVPVENRVALEFHFQCWTFLVEYVNRHKNEDEVRFAVSLLGLGQAGTKVGTGAR